MGSDIDDINAAWEREDRRIAERGKRLADIRLPEDDQLEKSDTPGVRWVHHAEAMENKK